MRIRPHRLAAAVTLLAVASLLAGCASSGTIADLTRPKSDDIVGSLFDPATAQKLTPNGKRQPQSGGFIAGTQSLPSFDNAPLPKTVQARQQSSPYTTDGHAVTGKLFFFRHGDVDSGNYYVCSGTVVQSKNSSLVWTAGHCVHDGRGGTWHEDMLFVPAFDDTGGDSSIDPANLDGNAPLGVFPVRHAWTSQQWIDTGDEHGGDLTHDYGVLEVGRNNQGQTLDDAVAGAGPQAGTPVPIWFNAPTFDKLDIFGYPAAPPYDGMSQWGCQVSTVQLLNVTELGPTSREYRAGCDLTGGASGGGWFAQAPGQASGKLSLVSNTSVGSAHSQSKSWLAGPYLDSEAQQLFNTANASAAP